jgi:hypothetical protein
VGILLFIIVHVIALVGYTRMRIVCRRDVGLPPPISTLLCLPKHLRYHWLYPTKPSFLTWRGLYGLLHRATEPMAASDSSSLPNRPGRFYVIGKPISQSECGEGTVASLIC